MKYYISVGSNSYNKYEMVENGIKMLKDLFPDDFVSSDKYETKCIGGYGNDYANAVVSFDSTIDSPTLAQRLKELEISAGRIKDNKQTVALDLDVVIADDIILRPKDYDREHFQIGYKTLITGVTDPKKLTIDEFVYDLPEDRIAIHPLPDRDQCKLLVCERNGSIKDDIFVNIDKYLDSNSVLVYNNTRVINARLRFKKESGALIEIFCLEPIFPSDYQLNFASTGPVKWKCFVGNSKRWKSGKLATTVKLEDHTVTLFAERISKNDGDSVVEFSWDDSSCTFAKLIEKAGEIPIPPYLNRSTEKSDLIDYQTIFSRIEGSVAAPTAGLHFTPEVLSRVDAKGILRREVTLHVGAGTFQPVKAETIGGHAMHSEFIVVERSLIEELANTTRTVVAVGTTSVRTLESLYHIGCKVKTGDWSGELEQWYPYSTQHPRLSVKESLTALCEWLKDRGETRLVASTMIIIAPGYDYKIVKRMITNFHQPGSTLLLLVSAMIGDRWKTVYEHALSENYRFLSYGDACLFSVTSSRTLEGTES